MVTNVKGLKPLDPHNISDFAGIIYCLSRANCESVCKGLMEHGIEAVVYHSELKDKARNEAQTKWLSGEKKVSLMI